LTPTSADDTAARGSPWPSWRRLDSGRQALLALAHLRNGDTLTRLSAGFQVGVAAAWRCIREAITLLAVAANDLHQAMTRIRLLAYVILDGTLIPIDRVHDQKPYYSGKLPWRTRRRHPQDLENPDRAALQPLPDDRNGAGLPRSPPRRKPDLPRRKTLSHADRP
jgi:hypothetical protein